jgi:hypothetical protein
LFIGILLSVSGNSGSFISRQKMSRWTCYLCQAEGRSFEIPKFSNYHEESTRHYIKYHYIGE